MQTLGSQPVIMPNNLPDHCVAFGGSRPKDSVPICLLANLVLTHFSFGLPTIKLGHYSMPRWRRPLDLVGHSVKKYRPFPSFLPSFLSFPLVMFSTNKIQQISGIPNLQGPPCMRYIYIYPNNMDRKLVLVAAAAGNMTCMRPAVLGTWILFYALVALINERGGVYIYIYNSRKHWNLEEVA